MKGMPAHCGVFFTLNDAQTLTQCIDRGKCFIHIKMVFHSTFFKINCRWSFDELDKIEGCDHKSRNYSPIVSIFLVWHRRRRRRKEEDRWRKKMIYYVHNTSRHIIPMYRGKLPVNFRYIDDSWHSEASVVTLRLLKTIDRSIDHRSRTTWRL